MISPVRAILALVLLLLIGYFVLTQVNWSSDAESVSPSVAPPQTPSLSDDVKVPDDVKAKIDKDRAVAEAVVVTGDMVRDATFHITDPQD
ncbi:MAG: hypothetical protein LBU45_01520, partial [Azoarcus sp.]|nr:hypothetical protein [Azoarcus sp.]